MVVAIMFVTVMFATVAVLSIVVVVALAPAAFLHGFPHPFSR